MYKPWVVAAFIVSITVSPSDAQYSPYPRTLPTPPRPPSGGNPIVPAPNPGGPGLTPYPGGAQEAPSAEAPETAAPTSATQARHYHHQMYYHHKKMAIYHRGKAYPSTGTTADQLNQEELARLQGGNMSMPPPMGAMTPPPPSPSLGTTEGGAPYR